VRVLVTRILLAVCAVLACAWFALGARQAHELSAAQSIIQTSTNLTPAQAAHARSLLSAARTLNPDRAVTMTRAQVDLQLGQLSAAYHALTGVVHAEPENVEAWLLLSEASYGRSTLTSAVAKVAALDPQDAKRRR
jgi:predicted Zn-dependent protease